MAQIIKDRFLDATSRLRIATRIRFALLRHLGESVDVGAMLKRDNEAREVIWVCEASGDAELVSLAHQFSVANAAAQAIRAAEVASAQAAGGHERQETPWARDTSGFGVSQPPEMSDTPRRDFGNTVSSAWFNPAGWLRSARTPH